MPRFTPYLAGCSICLCGLAAHADGATRGASITAASPVESAARSAPPRVGAARVQPCQQIEEFMTIVSCTSPGQLCDPALDHDIITFDQLLVNFTTSPFHCSDVGLLIDLDGVQVAQTLPLTPGESSGTIDLGPVPMGRHLLSFHGYGVKGGCNSGMLATWGGTFQITTTRYALCSGDLNGDGVVDFADLNIVLSDYGSVGDCLAGDVDGDGDCDFADLNALLSAYGSAC